MDGVGKEMRDPFVLNPEHTVSDEQREKYGVNGYPTITVSYTHLRAHEPEA